MHNSKLLISKTCTGNSKIATDGALAHFKLCGFWPSHIWMPTISEELVCRMEVGNIYDLHCNGDILVEATW